MKFPVLSWISSLFFCFRFFFCHFFWFLHSRDDDNSDNFSCVADDHNVDDDKEKEELGQDSFTFFVCLCLIWKSKGKGLHNSILFVSFFGFLMSLWFFFSSLRLRERLRNCKERHFFKSILAGNFKFFFFSCFALGFFFFFFFCTSAKIWQIWILKIKINCCCCLNCFVAVALAGQAVLMLLRPKLLWTVAKLTLRML